MQAADDLDLRLRPALCGLAAKQESLGKRALTAQLERSKVFVQSPAGTSGLSLDPEAELAWVSHADGPVTHSFDQMLAARLRVSSPSDPSSASAAEDHAAQFIA